MPKPIDAETESVASDILSLKGKPEALENFVATYIAQNAPDKVEKLRQYLESKGEKAISKQFVPDARISAMHIDFGPQKSAPVESSVKEVSLAEFNALAQKDIGDFKKDVAGKSASIVTVESDTRNYCGVFIGKCHSEIEGEASVIFDGDKVAITDAKSGINYKLETGKDILTVSYPNGSVKTITGRHRSDSDCHAFVAKTPEGTVGYSSDKRGIVVALPDKVFDIDTRPRQLLPGKGMQTEPIETRPPRMYVDKRGESLASTAYEQNGQTLETLIAEIKAAELFTEKANQMTADFKTLVTKQEAAPVQVDHAHDDYGYFVGKLHSEIPGKIKVDHDESTLIVDDIGSGSKYEFASNQNGKDTVTVSYPDGRKNTYDGEVSQTRGDRYFAFVAKTPDGGLGFEKNGDAILIALPDKVLDIRWQARHLSPPKQLQMDRIEISPPRMFVDKRGESLAIEKYGSVGSGLEYEFQRLN